MATFRTCDGVNRRNFLKVGGLGFMGLDLAGYLRMAHAADPQGKKPKKNAIYIFLTGGPTHHDTFDMKPDAPKEIRGEFKPMATNVPGVEICELMPKLAQQADKFAIVRSVTHALSVHGLGQLYLRSGNRPLPSLQFPSMGSVANKELPAEVGLPGYVNLPVNPSNGLVETSGYLGIAYSPFTVHEDANKKEFSVRALTLPQGFDAARIASRKKLYGELDHLFRGIDVKSPDLDGMDRFYKQAFEILSSAKAREAFEISKEDDKLRDKYTRTQFGQSCLLARRLIESGVRFVGIDFGNWDNHQQVFGAMKGKLPGFSAALAALLQDLADRGLLESTVVCVTGEFGRTPKINENAGRDHWARAMSILPAGGGIKGGQVIGKTNDKGEEPTGDQINKPEDFAYSFLHALGIDPTTEYHTPGGRPVQIVREGKLIKGLF